jgi:hypothetical protein
MAAPMIQSPGMGMPHVPLMMQNPQMNMPHPSMGMPRPQMQMQNPPMRMPYMPMPQTSMPQSQGFGGHFASPGAPVGATQMPEGVYEMNLYLGSMLGGLLGAVC